MTDLSWRVMRRGLVAAAMLHVLIVGLYVLDVIPQTYHNTAQSYFWLHHGGDDHAYISLARDIVKWDFHANKYPLGFPLTLTPFMITMHTTAHDDLLPVVAVFWGLIMFPLGQWVLAALAERITGSRRQALLSVFAWTALPLVVYVAFRAVSNAVVAETYSVHLTWQHMLSDGPATLFVLLAMLVWAHSRTEWARSAERARTHNLYWAALLGLLCGFLVLIRLPGLLTVGIIGLLLIAERRWRDLLVMGAVGLIVVSPQLAYNAHFFDSPFKTGYTVLDDLPSGGLFALSYLTDGLTRTWNRAGWLLIPAAVTGAAAAWIGLAALWRQSRLYASAIFLWITGYCAFYSVYYYSWNGGLLRFLMPVYPAAAIIAAACADTVYRQWRTWRRTLRRTLRRKQRHG
ncbi:MAG: hypothetical protein JW966_09755 [Anaerolineae bacterium]|nr:hypothetical protein [Anaerolineae bacterium]